MNVQHVLKIVWLHWDAILESILLEMKVRGPASDVLRVICEFILILIQGFNIT